MMVLIGLFCYIYFIFPTGRGKGVALGPSVETMILADESEHNGPHWLIYILWRHTLSWASP